MATKRLQLRGISRTPSDRMTDDGGCSESLNVQLDSTEIAPAFVPEDVTMELGLPDGLQAERIFIHKTANYENYIVVQGGKVVAYTPGIEDEEPLEVLNLSDGEVVSDITAVGNTLSISTTANLYYVLYNDKKYTFLGNKVPFPIIKFEIEYENYSETIATEQRDWTTLSNWDSSTQEDPNPNPRVYENGTPIDDIWVMSTLPTKQDWEKESSGQHSNKYIQDLIGILKNHISKEDAFVHKENEISSPIFIRYSVDLYGDKLSSMPILLNPASSLPAKTDFTVYQEMLYNTAEDYYAVRHVGYNKYKMNDLRKCGKIKATFVNQEDLLLWSDILTSIEIYISKPLPYSVDLDLSTIDNINESITDETGSFNYYSEHYPQKKTFSSSCVINFKEDEDYKSKLLQHSSQCFLIKSIEPFNESRTDFSDDLKKLLAGDILEIDKYLNPTAEDYIQLETQEMLSGDDMKHYILTSPNVSSFNNQLLFAQSSQIIDYDYPDLNAIQSKEVDYTSSWSKIRFEVTYLIKGAIEDKVVKKTFEYNDSDGTSEEVYAFQIFPDSRCYKMLVKAIFTLQTGAAGTTTISYGEFDMLPHPYIDCAYYYGGINSRLTTHCTQDFINNYSANAIDDLENKLIVSQIDKPFIFPQKSRYTFQSKIVGVAIATTALSQGQFGQFPLYVFTEDGIWAMETAADGSFISQKPLSRDVCINPDSICVIDNAVIFVTAQGVMMLQGSQVTNISPYMNGRHYVIEGSAKTIVESQDFFCELIPALSDSTHFMAFIKEARVAYDYAGRRLIFIKEGEEYQYVYKLDTQTWHKIAFGINLSVPLNSYPECLVQTRGEARETVFIYFSSSDITQKLQVIKALSDSTNIGLAEAKDFIEGTAPLDKNIVGDLKPLLDSLSEEYSFTYTLTEESAIIPAISRVYSLSTILDAAESRTPTRGVIVTRPFDLDEPDVYKTITDVRIRGQFPRGAVKFILLGSNDGINFCTISTLRGKSWKLFRLVILADLAPTERISWVDIQYETRFANKLR